jgi:hypothetical protein
MFGASFCTKQLTPRRTQIHHWFPSRPSRRILVLLHQEIHCSGANQTYTSDLYIMGSKRALDDQGDTRGKQKQKQMKQQDNKESNPASSAGNSKQKTRGQMGQGGKSVGAPPGGGGREHYMCHLQVRLPIISGLSPSHSLHVSRLPPP